MASDFMNTTTNAPFIPEIVANQALGRLGAYLNLGKTVAKDNELTSAQVGDTINVPKRGALVANQKAESGQVTVQKPTSTTVPVLIDQHWEVTFGEQSRTKAVQAYSTVPGYVQDAVIALAEKIEASLAGLYSQFTNSTAEIAGGLKPVESLIDARTQMVLRNVPRLETKFAYLHPTFVAKLSKAEAFIDPKLIPNNQALVDGAVGRAAGFDIFEGQLVSGSGSPSNYQNLLYTRDAMVLASRPLELPDAALGVQAGTAVDENGIALRVLRSYNPNDLGVQVTLDTLFGTAVLDDRLGEVFLSA